MPKYFEDCKIVSAGVDWLTCSANTPASGETLWQLGLSLGAKALNEGELATRWHGHGYDGWQVTGCAFGARAESVILRLSGQEARDNWRKALTTADNASRFDIAVDAEFKHPVPSAARDLYREIGHRPSRNGRPPQRTLITNSDGGATCYVGSRSSERFGRLYDKGIEQKSHAPGYKWRWEVELKKAAALHTASKLLPLSDDYETLIATSLGYFSDRGGRVPAFDGSRTIYHSSVRSSTIDKQISWLASSVRPSVQRLIDSVGPERVLTALGITFAPDLHRKAPLSASKEYSSCQQQDRLSARRSEVC